jgi:hypothetical protein
MKTSQLKTLVKEAVKEAIQEELREILLEAVKSPKVVTESKDTYAQPNLSNPKQLTPQERKDMFSGILGEMQQGGAATTAYQGTFNPQGTMPGGDLPSGEVGMDQIMNMIK